MIHTLRRILAIATGKILIITGKLFGKRSSAAPGKVVMRIAPDILQHLASQVRHGIIVVCGTNGKTTTNNLIYTLLSKKGYKVVCNRLGANMLYGAVTAFVDAAKMNGNVDADYACIEVDELSAVNVFEHFTPTYIVITNLFRDQLDRYGEIDITIGSLKRAAAMADGATLILNADDPLLVAFGKQSDAKCVYFGVNSEPRNIIFGSGLTCETKESRFCRLCGAELEYEAYYYSQIGRYSCSSCDFARPVPEYTAENINLSCGIAFDVCTASDGSVEHITANYRGFYNIYNMLAAYAVLRQCDIRTDDINETFANLRPQIGRMETFTIGDKQVVLNLSKNPAGFNQAISTLTTDMRKKAIVLVINDNEQDGRDISWLWDVDFERLFGIADNIIVSGLRANDMLLRMKYACFDMDNVSINPKVKEAITFALLSDCDVVYTLVNYTALFSTHDWLNRMERVKKI